ncbi:hypothetical protein [Aureimonas sp. AU12]|uniref:hypothetical protein n=1 Tax=Aureimonas sp. AU12 TaxID=1638161 RepID=UPI001FCD96A9|nr:hypothetical protein [Aureimonas sp. AU12]
MSYVWSSSTVSTPDLFASDAEQNDEPHPNSLIRAAIWWDCSSSLIIRLLLIDRIRGDVVRNLSSGSLCVAERFRLVFAVGMLQRSTSWLERVGIMGLKSSAASVAASRARRRESGMRAMEAVLHEKELAALDRLKCRLNLASRSEALRLLMAKTDLDNFTPEDAARLRSDVA